MLGWAAIEMILDDKWFEVWFVPDVDGLPAYLVVVSPDAKATTEIIVRDITENKELFAASSYEDVFNWLTEDEFAPIQGRVFY